MDIYPRQLLPPLPPPLLSPLLPEPALATVTSTVSVTVTETITERLLIQISPPTTSGSLLTTISTAPRSSSSFKALTKRWTTDTDIYQCFTPDTTPTSKIKPFHKWTTEEALFCTPPPASPPTHTVTYHSTFLWTKNFYCVKDGPTTACGRDTKRPDVHCTLTH
ncbi:hypothetical protein B9Z65_8276 [Elsinoe australis]|uniref:Uncharacterized protein n=1 Tax=Elsinoe australis TaxID=40998 RepID=A0A2P7YDB6_9PEZI|nr:hypothetical protein B9Z65_8276 [Elsinoe australis]